MTERNTTVTRRRFLVTSMMGVAGVSAAPLAGGQLDVATYRALGLHEPPDLGGVSAEDFARFLNPPADNQYHPCAEAYPDPATPRGEVTKHEGWSGSRIFGGTERNVWVYVPDQLEAATVPADLIVFQDGAGYVNPTGPVRAPTVLDSLIHSGDLRPTVGVFVNPGTKVPPRDAEDPEFGRQRSLEYDSVTDAYVRFVLDELLPFVEREIGRPVSADPARRAICGLSSGGICAWTAAWFRPDAFGRVLSHCGSFTNIRGGHNYPYLVRTTARKPIRAFLTSGTMDLDIPIGNWPLANRQMASALDYAGYGHRFEFGEGGHTLRHGGAIFAQSLRWLMRS